jgi:DNA-binding FrmR family transcriptional regulator
MQLVAAVRGATSGLGQELIEHHLRMHVIGPDQTDEARARAAEELLAVLRTYRK